MRSFWFGGKVALLFILLLGMSLGGASLLFLRIAGPPLAGELIRSRAYEAVAVAEALEVSLADDSVSLGDARIADQVRREGAKRELQLSLHQETEPPELRTRHRRIGRPLHPTRLEIRGREVRHLGRPTFDLWVPIRRQTEVLGHLRVRGPVHADQVHRAFAQGLIRIGGLALLSVVVLTAVLTAPLRRMSRSMDRVAAGELDHRVSVRGRDEVAVMGRSFNAMADRIQDLVRGQKEMLAGASHELRSPLARMKMTLELLRAGSRQPERHLEALEEEVDHIDGLVGELLIASRLDFAAAPLHLAVFELQPVIEAAWQRSRPPGGARVEPGIEPGVELRIELAPAATEVEADPELVARILGNLLANSGRYARTEVRVMSRPRARRLEIEVTDDGPGVAAGELERLFEPFFRADPSRAHGRHVGLGLSIAKKAVEAHGGTIRAQGGELGGLSVVFDLPA